MMNNARKIYTSRAGLCALGCYLTQQRVFDDLQRLSLPQKKGVLYTLGETARYAHADFCRGDRHEPA